MSDHHIHTGKKGESLAAEYLLQKGFTILHSNWRWSRYEIDIIAIKDNILHFIEVKTRRTADYGFPEESISKWKLQCMLKAGAAFLGQHGVWKRVQYNVLSITLVNNKPPEYFFIEDVYL
jgi:putative endonuclease